MSGEGEAAGLRCRACAWRCSYAPAAPRASRSPAAAAQASSHPPATCPLHAAAGQVKKALEERPFRFEVWERKEGGEAWEMGGEQPLGFIALMKNQPGSIQPPPRACNRCEIGKRQVTCGYTHIDGGPANR